MFDFQVKMSKWDLLNDHASHAEESRGFLNPSFSGGLSLGCRLHIVKLLEDHSGLPLWIWLSYVLTALVDFISQVVGSGHIPLDWLFWLHSSDQSLRAFIKSPACVVVCVCGCMCVLREGISVHSSVLPILKVSKIVKISLCIFWKLLNNTSGVCQLNWSRQHYLD